MLLTEEPDSISVVDISINDTDPIPVGVTKIYILDSAIASFINSISYDSKNNLVWMSGGHFLALKTGQHLTFVR